MNYAKIFECDTNNGEGFRVSLFVSGCHIHCKNCHNKFAQDFTYGIEYTQKTEDKIINLMSKKYIRGFSLLGGEPFDNLKDKWLYNLLKRIKENYPKKTIYCWTGYHFENLIQNNKAFELLQYIDMLRDGEYIDELKNLNQWLGGSKNQRYIDVQKSLKENNIITWKRAIQKNN